MGRVYSLFKTEKGRAEYEAAYARSLALWSPAFVERDVTTGFGRAHVVLCGDEESPPLVLLHSAQASSTMWYPNIAAFAAVRRVYAIDSPMEAGKSRPDAAIKDRTSLARWLLEILDHLGIDRADLAGASRGAWDAVNFALAYPGRVASLALYSPAQVFTPITSLAFLGASLRCAFLPTDSAVTRMMDLVFLHPEKAAPAFVEQYLLALRNFNILKGVGVPLAVFSDAELRQLSIPVLVMIGDADVINGEASIARAKLAIPGADTEIVPDAGHILTMDRPDVVNSRTIDFLDRNN